jgi:hypothetical protein
MTDEPVPTVTDADVRSLAAKLKGLHALLTPSEQALLRLVLDRAAAREEAALGDVQGHRWAVSFNPLPYLDAIYLDGLVEQGISRHEAVPNKATTERTVRRRDAARKPG